MDQDREFARTDRMVLRERPAEDKAFRFADELGFELIKDFASDARQGIVRDLVWRVVPGITFQYAEDSRSDCAVVALAGKPADSVKRMGDAVARYFNPWSVDELVRSVDSADGAEDRWRTVIRLGMGAPQKYKKRIAKRLRDAILSPDEHTRFFGIWGVSYSRWPELRDMIRMVAESDPNENLRKDAATILRHYDS